MAQLWVSLIMSYHQLHVQYLQTCCKSSVISFLIPAGMDFPDTATDLTFSPSLPTQTAMVFIVDDSVPENMLEYFSLILTSTDRAAILDPTTANVTIVDNMDSKNYQMNCFIYVTACGR